MSNTDKQETRATVVHWRVGVGVVCGEEVARNDVFGASYLSEEVTCLACLHWRGLVTAQTPATLGVGQHLQNLVAETLKAHDVDRLECVTAGEAHAGPCCPCGEHSVGSGYAHQAAEVLKALRGRQ